MNSRRFLNRRAKGIKIGKRLQRRESVRFPSSSRQKMMKSVTGDINVPGYYKKDVFQTSPRQASHGKRHKNIRNIRALRQTPPVLCATSPNLGEDKKNLFFKESPTRLGGVGRRPEGVRGISSFCLKKRSERPVDVIYI